MPNEVIFENLRTGASVRGTLSFTGGRLIPDPHSSSGIPHTNPPQNYPNIIGIAVDASSFPQNASLDDVLVGSYRFTLEILTAIAAKYQTYAYLSKPILCTYNRRKYILDEDTFEDEEAWKHTHQIYGGKGFCDDISFLNKKRNPRLILHFYREAQDESNPIDYRVLQLWRFLEGWFGTSGGQLVNDIVALGYYEELGGWDDAGKKVIHRYRITRRYVNSFYRHYRSAVAHGGGQRGGHSRKVYYPKLLQFYSDIWLKLDDMIAIAGEVLRRSPGKQY